MLLFPEQLFAQSTPERKSKKGLLQIEAVSNRRLSVDLVPQSWFFDSIAFVVYMVKFGIAWQCWKLGEISKRSFCYPAAEECLVLQVAQPVVASG